MTMWVFGYGSLIWNPGFEVAEKMLARLPGYVRSFCMRSIHHRGTEEHPGLVLALDKMADHVCHGVGFRVQEGQEEKVLAYLRERELVSSAYLEETHVIMLKDGRLVDAVTYVVDTDHVQYCGGLDLEEQARIIAGAKGGMGPNHEYLFNTASHLAELGIRDPELSWLSTRVRILCS
ncbi:gamma-glutamylcyclotransferase [Alisedimentitalea sp. MJ-SS2]|uniref:gamma-glutamylcyclotransferase n=1 Tax=Aliisedimentitalea sp. MJ-SS2 TaxID=3049795 RepID=UPI00290C619E|nr:gamma-glutamylcyclotransferase [Alisedimentitalea sp. MJ-SS2]MDU8926073.1 gamma-glutamylcyclotransferase [Alisedimentitalea sp. MJ-SS2]